MRARGEGVSPAYTPKPYGHEAWMLSLVGGGDNDNLSVATYMYV